VAPEDYPATSGTVLFKPGVTNRLVGVSILGDTVIEPDEKFFVKLLLATNAIIAKAVGVFTIVNDDSFTLGASSITASEGDIGVTNLTFTITLRPGTARR
jgi:hypothetical protein